MKVSILKLGSKNPRQIKDDRFEKLKQSIHDFPKMMELRPMVYDPDTMEVLGGNMRLRAIRELGMKEIPDTWVRSAVELTDEEKQRFSIADNVGFGEWDWDIIANEWDGLPLVDWGLDLPDFNKELKDENYDGGISSENIIKIQCGDVGYNELKREVTEIIKNYAGAKII